MEEGGMMGAVTSMTGQFVMDMQTWRGYSAFEIAVQHGFEGTEEEWLASLKGERGDDAATITVNHKAATDKNIMLYGTDIYVQSGTTKTVAQAMENIVTTDIVVDDLDSDDTTKPLSAAAGKRLAQAIAGFAKIHTEEVVLAASAWGSDNQQTVNVEGVGPDVVLLVTAAPDSYGAYSDAVVWCSAQGEGTLTFSARYTPSTELKANVLMIMTEEAVANV